MQKSNIEFTFNPLLHPQICSYTKDDFTLISKQQNFKLDSFLNVGISSYHLQIMLFMGETPVGSFIMNLTNH